MPDNIYKPEFINLQPLDISPLISKCEIKLFYLGNNDNFTSFDKNAAIDIGKKLRGSPIVGHYKAEDGDFKAHGMKQVLDDDGYHVIDETRPYGFVPTDAEVWFQKFEETNRRGETVIREYLMTTGFLWTGQYPEELTDVDENGRPQSMKLYSPSVQGDWQVNSGDGEEYFAISSAVIENLCILGNDVEPCFEEAKITKPDISNSFSLNEDFTNKFYQMLQQISYSLKGGKEKVEGTENKDTTNEFTENDAANAENIQTEAEVNTDYAETEVEAESTEESSAEFAKEEESDDKKDKDKDKDAEEDYTQAEDNGNADGASEEYNADAAVEETPEAASNEFNLETKVAELEKANAEYEKQINDLQDKFSLLQNSYNEVMREKKENLIGEFSMLSDDDKKDVVENIDSYSYDDIEAKLSIIFARKQVKKVSEASNKNHNEIEETLTFSLDQHDETPEWIKRVEEEKNKNK